MSIQNGLKRFLRYWRKSSHQNLHKLNDSKSPTKNMSDTQPTQPPTDTDAQFDLKPAELKKPLDKALMGGDVAGLNALLGFLNNPAVTGAQVPQGVNVKATPLDRTGATIPSTDPAIAGAPTPAARPRPVPRPIQQPAGPRELKPITATRFAFTGRLKAGKDHAAAAIGAKIFGFADPLYYLLDYFFGTQASTNPKDKDLPGARSFLQTIGQWGWGANDANYPFTPARAVFTQMIRALGRSELLAADLQVDWESFGLDKEIWVKAALKRIDAFAEINPGHRIGIVNCRFEHEFNPLREAGFAHWHVMCSPKTWEKRLAAAGLTTKSPEVSNLSEKLAAGLDADVIKKISNRAGGMLHVIWNDPEVPCPSPRLYTLPEFLQCVSAESVQPSIGVAAGE